MKHEYNTGFTKEDFKIALSKEGLLNEYDLKLLNYHYQMENHSASATQLSKLMNFKSHTAINLTFSRIAKKNLKIFK